MHARVSPLTVQSSAQTTSPLGSTFCLCGNSKSIVKVTFAPVKVGESLATLNSTLPPEWWRQDDSGIDSYTTKELNPQGSDVFVPAHFPSLCTVTGRQKDTFPLWFVTFPGVFVSWVSIFPDWVHLGVPWWITGETVSGLWITKSIIISNNNNHTNFNINVCTC